MLYKNYQKLNTIFYKKTKPTPVRQPEWVIFNDKLGEQLDIIPTYDWLNYLSGNSVQEGSQPIAQAYAGHQFGHFNMLGDGRAILLGELKVKNDYFDLQLKGSGPTFYSRRGDGRATLSSMLREYLISESMFHLNVPTTRSLAVVKTGQDVVRENVHDGGILTRISKGHIRVGTFQYAAARGPEHLKALTDYVIKQYYPDLLELENPYTAFLDLVIKNQASLIAKWQSIGFIHGVMNTDNMSVLGETIDYGPCAFMDTYHPRTVFSSIDHQGRYAYGNQPGIGQWNITRFAETLLPLLDENLDKSVSIAEASVSRFKTLYDDEYLNIFAKKIGVPKPNLNSLDIINKLVSLLESEELDFTNTFMMLSKGNYQNGSSPLDEWIKQWQNHLEELNIANPYPLMQENNPTIIPRNNIVESALSSATTGDLSLFKSFLRAIEHPFDYSDIKTKYTLPSTNEAYVTYCGT